LKKRWPSKRLAAYAGVVLTCLVIAVVAGWTALAARIDNYAYDFLFGLYARPDPPAQSAVLAIDEATLRDTPGGTRRIRTILAEALELMAPARPKAVAIDVILADQGDDHAEDQRLARAMHATRNLVLPCDLAGSRWEDPVPLFRSYAAAIGHIHADRNPYDNVSRQIPLEQTAPGDRRWALSLEAFRLARGAQAITESPDDIDVGGVRIPAPREGDQRPMRVRYRASIPAVTVDELRRNHGLGDTLRDRVVFLGVTALTYARDRLKDPLGRDLPGVEIHAHAFETMSGGDFLTPASNLMVLALCLALAAAAGLTFWFASGWTAYGIAAVLLIAAHFGPALFFQQGIVFPYFASVSAAWLPLAGAAAFQYFSVRRQLRKSESDKARYQQAIHFVTHEMRTPLTAIQGSSELISRYDLNEDKRRQIAGMINSESKRLARMIQTFLNVERLSEGQMEIKREAFSVRDLIEPCLARAQALAERKQIRVFADEICDDAISGDRELMEYAVYNLLTNAIKYSPPDTEVRVTAGRERDRLRLSVRDQGIGMDARELRNIFKKFYRTKKAENSGEAGTGIGLSIVEQIVTHHGGRIDVTSSPGRGSTFTIVLPAHAAVAASTHAPKR
jgi:signal transduction histidine kinase